MSPGASEAMKDCLSGLVRREGFLAATRYEVLALELILYSSPYMEYMENIALSDESLLG